MIARSSGYTTRTLTRGGKTHVVEFEVIRNSDNTIVKTETFTIPSGDTSMYTGYYQIPAGFTNTSYRIHLTATGSPSFSNTWHQWISGESGVASLPVELSDTLKTGVFMVLLLFIGGIFSYFSGPHGAVVVFTCGCYAGILGMVADIAGGYCALCGVGVLRSARSHECGVI